MNETVTLRLIPAVDANGVYMAIHHFDGTPSGAFYRYAMTPKTARAMAVMLLNAADVQENEIDGSVET